MSGASTHPWMREPMYFKKVCIAASAAMSMSSHATSGVEKGLLGANRMPIEVMGFLHGHIDPECATTFLITDAFPLPVEGTETSVVADSPEVQNYMIALQASLEATRTAPFVGWYHSHPFDVSAHSAAFLSGTDVSSQLGWQIHEDRAGNPWFALVVDPLRAKVKGRPVIGAFRCYPTNYSPPRGHSPDGEQSVSGRGDIDRMIYSHCAPTPPLPRRSLHRRSSPQATMGRSVQCILRS